MCIARPIISQPNSWNNPLKYTVHTKYNQITFPYIKQHFHFVKFLINNFLSPNDTMQFSTVLLYQNICKII